MREAVLSQLAVWQNFYVIIGSAAATLTGLMFVVITLTVGVRRRGGTLSGDGIATFSTPSVVHYCVALLVAAVLNAPWTMLWPAGLLLGLCGLGGVIYVIIVIRRARRLTVYQPVLEDWLWHAVLPLTSYLALVIAGLLLMGDPVPALFVIAGATVLLLFIGIHNAWDNVTYTALNFALLQGKEPE
ncbi:MAG TPA: hypothetical protein VFN23_21280 [Ktedonobacteraceae bacterium]|nr:hypothetical protein [Ktedonobacteraceae bacterium]